LAVTPTPREPYLQHVKAFVLVALTIAPVALTACGGGQPRPGGEQPGELRIVETNVPGAPIPIEGEFSYVRVSGEDGGSVAERRLDPGDALHLSLAAGSYTLSVWHRTCDGNCGYLDPPSDRCEETLVLRAHEVTSLTIENTPGSPCQILRANQ
jgi:hypothetical protein